MKYFCVLFADKIKFVGENKLRIISLQVLPEDTSEKVKQGDKLFIEKSLNTLSQGRQQTFTANWNAAGAPEACI